MKVMFYAQKDKRSNQYLFFYFNKCFGMCIDLYLFGNNSAYYLA